MKKTLDIAVVGSGPNGLTAANRLASAGHRVVVYEKFTVPGGAARSEALFGPGSVVDVGAAAHPFGIRSTAFNSLQLENWGVEWTHPEYSLAHPFEDSKAAFLKYGVNATSTDLGVDSQAWANLHAGVANNLDNILPDILSPMTKFPSHPVSLLRLGVPGVFSAQNIARYLFKTPEAKALFAGSALHSMMPLNQPLSGAFGILFSALGMTTGWPIARGGTQVIVDALVARLHSLGGEIVCNTNIKDIKFLKRFNAVLFDVMPRDLSSIADDVLDPAYNTKLLRWKPGIGVSKVDSLLNSSVKWLDPRVTKAGTVHVGGTLEELDLAERSIHAGVMPERPYVMVCQQNEFDSARLQNRSGNIIWTYAHVPFGHNLDVQESIINQIERFAPGFSSQIMSISVSKPLRLQRDNPNLFGGDISGGALTGCQQLFRPTVSFHPYRCRAKGFYLCSSATPPGAGVHGMNGWNAAGQLLSDYRGQ